MSSKVRVLVEDLPQRHSDPRANLGPFGVPPWGGKDRSDPRKRGTPNQCVRNKANARRPPAADRGPTAPNKADWRAGTLALHGSVVRNKANAFPAKQRASPLQDKSYDVLDLQGASTKQSQSSRGQPWTGTGDAADAAGGIKRAKRSQLASPRPKGAPPGGVSAKRSQFPGSDAPGIRHRMPAARRCRRLWLGGGPERPNPV
jgi:hypothetical protein